MKLDDNVIIKVIRNPDINKANGHDDITIHMITI